MEVKDVRYNSERNPLKSYPILVWIKLAFNRGLREDNQINCCQYKPNNMYIYCKNQPNAFYFIKTCNMYPIFNKMELLSKFQFIWWKIVA